MQLNMSFFINFFKRLFSNESEEKVQEVKPVAVKRTLPPTPINPMTDEVENSNTVTHDLIHEIEKNKHVQEEQKSSPVAEVKAEPVAKEAIKVEKVPEATVEVNTEVKVEKAPKTEPEPVVKEEVKVAPKGKPVAKAKVNTETKAKTTAKATTKAKPATKAKAKSVAKSNVIPKTIVLDESETKLNTKAKRIVGHCKKSPEAFIVTHIVKPDQEKLRLNLALSNWDNVDGLSFVTYDSANDAIVFSKKCDTAVAAKLNDVLLAWAREVHKNYY